jgi:hypothetical protein
MQTEVKEHATDLNLGLVALPAPKAIVHPDSIRPCGEATK